MPQVPTLSFAVIAEGQTDHAVLKQMLIGYCDNPDLLVTLLPEPSHPGGWDRVFKHCHKDVGQLLARHSFVVIHIDGDWIGLSSKTKALGATASPEDIIRYSREQLAEAIGAPLMQQHGDRILFAVAVDTIECWLLPFVAKTPPDAALTTGCGGKLKKLQGKAYQKDVRTYERIVRPYAASKELAAKAQDNPSLKVFYQELCTKVLLPKPAE